MTSIRRHFTTIPFPLTIISKTAQIRMRKVPGTPQFQPITVLTS
jgi:hypothetical protein